MNIISDLHTHPSLKPYNMKGYMPGDQVDMWREYQENKAYMKKVPCLVRGSIKETVKYSQANLNKMIQANMRVPFFSIYPIERGMFDLTSAHRKKKLPRHLLDLILKPKHYPYLGAAVSGIPLEKVKKIIRAVDSNQGINYFEKETFDEYQFIINQSHKKSPEGKKYTIVSDYQELENILNYQTDTIGGILTIEGGHALLNVEKNEFFYRKWEDLLVYQQEFLRKSTLENINRLKGTANDQFTFDKKHVPFFVGLTHMFNNFLVGHARTFCNGKYVLPGTTDLFDQGTNQGEGISDLGMAAIERLLSRDNGRRILIDIKHFSMQAREEFYRLHEHHYVAKGDHVPIIASHVAVNGFENNDLLRSDTSSLNANEYFNRWSINFSDEDIRKVHKSGGLLGLVPHEGTMPGGKFKKKLKKLNAQEKRNEYLGLLWGNIFQIALAVGEKSAWDIMCLGSDFDGLMDPFNFYPDTTHLPQLALDMMVFLENNVDIVVYKENKESKITKEERRILMFGYNSQEVVEKIFFTNVHTFLAKYFNRSYLEEGEHINVGNLKA